MRALGGSTGQSDWAHCRLQSAADTATPTATSIAPKAFGLFASQEHVFEKNFNFSENFPSQIPEKLVK